MKISKSLLASVSVAILGMVTLVPASQAAPHALVTPGALSIASDGTVTITPSVFSTGAPDDRRMYACPASVAAASGNARISFIPCLQLSRQAGFSDLPTNIFSANFWNGASWGSAFNEAARTDYPHIVYSDQRQGAIFFSTDSVLIGSSSAPASEDTSVNPTDSDPGVSFAGPLITGASGRTADEDTAGTVRFTGKRLHQVTGATIGGIAVTVTSATRSALVLDFDALPAGKHDVVLTTKAGAKTTLRGFVTVR